MVSWCFSSLDRKLERIVKADLQVQNWLLPAIGERRLVARLVRLCVSNSTSSHVKRRAKPGYDQAANYRDLSDQPVA